jgi:hypothetical protein
MSGRIPVSSCYVLNLPTNTLFQVELLNAYLKCYLMGSHHPLRLFIILIVLGERWIKDEMGRACSMNGEKRNAYRIVMGKPKGKRPLGRPRRRLVDNIKMEIGWDGMGWIDLGQDRDQWRVLVNTVMNLRVP